MKRNTLILLALSLIFVACRSNEESTQCNINVNFSFNVNRDSLERDSMKYVNDAGNKYMVTDLQMIVSKLQMEHSDGTVQVFDKSVHFVDLADTSTFTWTIEDVPIGIYNSIGFVFGLDSTMNVTGAYPDPPINEMIWPESLGGGYHYMKLNCKWLADNELLPLNFHLGPEKMIDGSDTTVLDNSFIVTRTSDFEISSKFDNVFEVNVDVNRWFGPTCIIDFEKTKGVWIMESHEIQEMARENGPNVFSMNKKTIK